jgi:hypothetical protein
VRRAGIENTTVHYFSSVAYVWYVGRSRKSLPLGPRVLLWLCCSKARFERNLLALPRALLESHPPLTYCRPLLNHHTSTIASWASTHLSTRGRHRNTIVIFTRVVIPNDTLYYYWRRRPCRRRFPLRLLGSSIGDPTNTQLPRDTLPVCSRHTAKNQFHQTRFATSRRPIFSHKTLYTGTKAGTRAINRSRELQPLEPIHKKLVNAALLT